MFSAFPVKHSMNSYVHIHKSYSIVLQKENDKWLHLRHKWQKWSKVMKLQQKEEMKNIKN
jgi:hypothetical protein